MRIKIFDCFVFNNEKDLLKIRLNILNKFVDYFIIIEAGETHSGIKKKFNFNINHYLSFKKKIIYKKIKAFPKNLNAWGRENFQRNYISSLLHKANNEDFVLISDLDEIPNLKNINFYNIKKKIIVFRQRLFFYKLNYCEQKSSWLGTKACKKKFLKSPQWLRNLKTQKKYSFFRIDKLFFSKNYESSFYEVLNGGWHFSWIGTKTFIKNKIMSSAHTELNNSKFCNYNYINNCIKNLKPLNNIQKIKIIKIKKDSKKLPSFLIENYKKFKFFFDLN